MKAWIGTWRVSGLQALVNVYTYKVCRSRTYVDSVKAVRLDDDGMRNATIRREGDRYVVRYHRTDILSFAGSIVRLHIDGWNTTSTFDRVFTATGIRLRNGGSKNESVHNIRLVTDEGNTIPYFEGIEVNTHTGEILNPDKVPVDIRRRTMKITKEGAAKFRKLWAPVRDRLIREIKLGNTLENLQRQPPIEAWKILDNNVDKVVDPSVSMTSIEWSLRRRCRAFALGGADPTTELLAGVKKLRVSVQAAWAATNGYMEDIGGSVLPGPKYYGGMK